jgi:ppGpp synthetase/RelA/SpoT-type nucleotidyltranferase
MLSPGLTDPQISKIVTRYQQEMVRYEEAAHAVELRLRRELRGAASPSLLSSRAKHPDDLRGKLKGKRDKFIYETVLEDLSLGITDLAGCRVLVYHNEDEAAAAKIVEETFDLASRDGKEYETHDKDTGYRGIHFLVSLGDEVARQSLFGTVCEVQVTTLSSHVFNEIEHDILYKDHGVPGDGLKGELKALFYASRLLDKMVRGVRELRTEAVRQHQTPLVDAEQLRFTLERAAGRPLRGDFQRLFRMLAQVIHPFTVKAIDDLGEMPRVIESGRVEAERLDLRNKDKDDVALIALGLVPRFRDEFTAIAEATIGPHSALIRALLKVREGSPIE